MPEALTASQVGTWETEVERSWTVCDRTTAAMFGVAEDLGSNGLPLEDYVRAILPEDRPAFFDKIDRVARHGGLFVIEYRTMPEPGRIRWVLARGRYERDPSDGVMRGRGICIDITESKLDGHVEDKAFFTTPDYEPPLHRAATHAIAAREAIDEVPGADGRVLRNAVNGLLWALGRCMARRG